MTMMSDVSTLRKILYQNDYSPKMINFEILPLTSHRRLVMNGKRRILSNFCPLFSKKSTYC